MQEILVLEGDGGINYRVIYFYPIAAPVKVPASTGANIVPTPSSSLPDLAKRVGVLTQGQEAALDAGTLAFELHTFRAISSLAPAALLAALRADYAARKAKYQADYTESFKHAGKSFDAV